MRRRPLEHRARPTGPPRRRSRLRGADIWSLALLGLRGRPVRAALSAAGIALGVATMVAVFGISSSSRSQLLAEIDALGTNLLTVTPGQSFAGQNVTLPQQAPAMISRIGPVLADSAIGDVGANIDLYRNDRIPAADTNAHLRLRRTDLVALHPGGAPRPGQVPQRRHRALPGCGPRCGHGPRAWRRSSRRLRSTVDGRPSVLGRRYPPTAPARPRARSQCTGRVSHRWAVSRCGRVTGRDLRARRSHERQRRGVCPLGHRRSRSPQNVSVANPSDALVARADASAAFESLFVALGAVALLVGGVGIANVMVIAVLERRSEIGLRRALGATKTQVAVQFVSEAALLALIGGAVGAIAGGFFTTVYAAARQWYADHPTGGPGRSGYGRRRRRCPSGCLPGHSCCRPGAFRSASHRLDGGWRFWSSGESVCPSVRTGRVARSFRFLMWLNRSDGAPNNPIGFVPGAG